MGYNALARRLIESIAGRGEACRCFVRTCAEQGSEVVLSCWSLADLGTLVHRQLAHTLRPVGLTPAQYRVLEVLLEQGSITASELSLHIVLEQSLISRTVQALYEKGLLSRMRSRTDRRNVSLSVTATGAELIGELQQPLQELQERLTRGIPPERLQDATQIIEAIIVNTRQP